MRIHLRANSADSRHVHMTLFVNGANCGELCMTVEEANQFHAILAVGCSRLLDERFVSSGNFGDPSPSKENSP